MSYQGHPGDFLVIPIPLYRDMLPQKVHTKQKCIYKHAKVFFIEETTYTVNVVLTLYTERYVVQCLH